MPKQSAGFALAAHSWDNYLEPALLLHRLDVLSTLWLEPK
ncbi:hypothetical protein GXM_05877 [Nostoc sphaeroides CCNUC1]|uniref:Uncharacterized protein n=1 Tax=Nostoc sphaeroides CCNUC1 TaxID=2653204 RepID=A0A5P8W6I7_9NOSO|nr:hypothetical protein GXM_05877 [Nostoc sphaeroides CCNUC1]